MQSRQELVVRSVVFLQCCTTGVVVGRTRVVRYRGALGRRWQACPTVRSSVLAVLVQFMGGADEKIEGVCC